MRRWARPYPKPFSGIISLNSNLQSQNLPKARSKWLSCLGYRCIGESWSCWEGRISIAFWCGGSIALLYATEFWSGSVFRRVDLRECFRRREEIAARLGWRGGISGKLSVICICSRLLEHAEGLITWWFMHFWGGLRCHQAIVWVAYSSYLIWQFIDSFVIE